MKTNRTRMIVVALGVAALAAWSVCPAWADYITGVTVESRSSENGFRLASYTIDSDSTFDPVAGTLKASERGWMTVGTDYGPQITYNLGAVYHLASIHIWNWNQPNTIEPYDNYTKQGVKDVSISVAGTDGVFSVLEDSVALDKASGADGYMGQSILADAIDVQYVRLTPLDSWYATDGFYDRSGSNWMNETGIGKVMFTAIPEPGSFTILAMSLISVLVYAWRKRM